MTWSTDGNAAEFEHKFFNAKDAKDFEFLIRLSSASFAVRVGSLR